jgi:tetratricopeptide (TPR) repeat protein
MHGGTTDPFIASIVVRTCVLMPVEPAEADRLVRLAELASAEKKKSGPYLYVLGAAHFRAGHFEEAIRALEQSNDLDRSWRANRMSTALLAMAHSRLGDHEKARSRLAEADAWYEDATRQMEQAKTAVPPIAWHEWLEFQWLRREAATLQDDLGTSTH